MMVSALKTEHHNVVIEPEALCAALLPATDARDLPGMADVDSSLLLFCAAVKKGATVCLSGECADELFGGYPWYHREEILFEDTFPWSRSVDLRLGLLAPGVVQDGAEFVREHYLSTCRRAEKLPSDSKRDARMREMFVLNLDWFMATLLEGKVAEGYAFSLSCLLPVPLSMKSGDCFSLSISNCMPLFARGIYFCPLHLLRSAANLFKIVYIRFGCRLRSCCNRTALRKQAVSACARREMRKYEQG